MRFHTTIQTYTKVILLALMVSTLCYIPANALLLPFLSFFNNSTLMDEICDNGIDDDGDGLVDCYDPDCCGDAACTDFYYTPCAGDCELPPEDTDINASIAWTSPSNSFHQQSTAITADLDNDGEVEIIGRPQAQTGDYTKNLNIINGTTGAIETTIITPWMYFSLDGPIVGDLDRNGFVDIVVLTGLNASNAANEQRRLICYEYDGTDYNQKWISSSTVGALSPEQTGTSGGMADFNGDGLSEVYHENKVFDGLTGVLLVDGGAATNQGKGITGARTSGISVAADVLPDATCADCEGLELVLGDQVLAVTIDPVTPANNTIYIATETTTDLGDGYPSLADVDNDGDLDAIINGTTSSEGQFFIWDMQTSDQIYDTYNYTNVQLFASQHNNSHVATADFDGDGAVEFAFTTTGTFSGNIRVLKWTGSWTTLWQNNTTDIANPGTNPPSVFDFNGDGIPELLFRDFTTFRIIEGATGTTIYSDACASTTGFEVITVADIDDDDEAEVLCACGGALRAYESSGDAWMNARPIWNQHSYFNVNVNDDLTIPIEQQNHHLVGDGQIMNNFLSQFSQNMNLAADATLVIDSVDCAGSNITLNVTICNQGDVDLPTNVPISIYNSDPVTTGATLLSSQMTTQALLPTECIVASYTFPHNDNENFYAVINDDNSIGTPYDFATEFSMTAINECDYPNNLSFFNVPMIAPVPDLGNDITTCDASTILNPGTFDNYTWQDGSTNPTFDATSAGTYWVDVSNNCGGIARDSIVIMEESFNDSTFVNICNGDSYDFDGEIITNDTTICKNYTTLAGCDSIHCVVSTLIYPTIDTLFISDCEGSAYDFDGEIISNDTTICKNYTSMNGCDSTQCVTATFTNNIQDSTFVSICEGSTYDFDGELISNDTTVCKNYTSTNGCDSTHCVVATITLEINTTQTVNICDGDSYDFDGELITNDTTICKTYTAISTGCDSTHCVTSTLLLPTNTTQTVELCEGSSFDFDGEIITNDTTVCKNYTGINGCDSTHCVTAIITTTLMDSTFVSICEGDVYDFDGTPISTASTICKNYTSINNCDSIHCAVVSIITPITVNQAVDICEGSSYNFDGDIITTATTTCKNYSSINGCDSTHCIISTIILSVSDTADIELCGNATYDFDGTIISNDTTVCKTYLSAAGCDSISCIRATVIPVVQDTIMVTICEGDSYEFNGIFISNDTLICRDSLTSNGCFSTHCIDVSIYEVMELNPTITEASCLCDGTISLATTGIAPFSYQWSNGETTAQLQDLCPDMYTVTVTDGNGCSQDSSFTIVSTSNLSIDYTPTNITCFGDDNGSLEIIVNNGSAPFTYEWSSPITSTTSIADGLTSGTYSVTVMDNSGCVSSIENMEIPAPAFPLELSLESSNPGCSDFAQGMVEAIVDNGTMPYNYSWNTGDTTETLEDVEEGTYSVTVTDSNGCSISASTELTAPEGIGMIISTNDNLCYRGEEASITIDSAFGGTAPYSYSLDSVIFYDNNVFTGLGTGDYTIYIQDVYGCMGQQEVTIVEGLELPVDVNAVSTIDLGDSTQIETIGNLPAGVTYEWSPPYGLSCTDCLDPIASPAETTTYTLTFTDSLACVTERVITITVLGELEVFVPNVFTPNGDGVNDLLVVRASSGVSMVRSLYIFDRWGGVKFGKENFEPNDEAFGWDGIFNGQKLNPNVFAFIMEVEYQDGTTEIIRGDITLMR